MKKLLAPVLVAILTVTTIVTGSGTGSFGGIEPASAAERTCTSVGLRPAEGTIHKLLVPVVSRNVNSASCTLSIGDYNNVAVQLIQNVLRLCYGQNITVDNDYGPNTAAAVKRAQRQMGVAQTGVWDRDTTLASTWISSTRNGYVCRKLVPGY